jgi:hypothetical protein
VRASEKEGLEKFVEGSEVPAMGQIAHKILPYDEAEDFEQQHKGQARAIELYLFGLLLATLALLAEGWLGSHKPSRAGGAARLSSPAVLLAGSPVSAWPSQEGPKSGLEHARGSTELAEVLHKTSNWRAG